MQKNRQSKFRISEGRMQNQSRKTRFLVYFCILTSNFCLLLAATVFRLPDQYASASCLSPRLPGFQTKAERSFFRRLRHELAGTSGLVSFRVPGLLCATPHSEDRA